MGKNLLVSIITVCYNAQDTIESTIKSVLGQTYKHIEYIIVDGMSTDNTMNIVNRYSDQIAVIISEPDKGIYDAMNKGILISKGDLIGILNADDLYFPDSIAEVINRYCSEEKVDVICGDIIYKNELIQKKYRLTCSDPKRLTYEMPVHHPATFISSSAYQRYGLYSLKYQVAADREFLLRLYTCGATFNLLKTPVTQMRSGGASDLRNVSTLLEDKKITLKYGGAPTKAFFHHVNEVVRIFIRRLSPTLWERLSFILKGKGNTMDEGESALVTSINMETEKSYN